MRLEKYPDTKHVWWFKVTKYEHGYTLKHYDILFAYLNTGLTNDECMKQL